MKFTLSEQVTAPLSYILLLAFCLLFSCQSNDENTAATSQVEVTDTVTAADAAAARPAPSFFVIPSDMAKNRVWICIEASSDIFHVKHDCPVLKQCKGTFRNLTLTRAIEDFGRYNCQECSKDYDHIFDEQLVR
jgi:flavoprotein